MGPLALIAMLIGCANDPVCVDLRPHEDVGNHVQTYEVAMDPDRRRVYTTALGSSVLLVYDADSGAVLQDMPLGNDPLNTPEVELDSSGNVWVGANTDPPLMHFDVESGDRTILWDELSGARDLAPRAAGGMVVLGRSASSNNAIVAYDAELQPVASFETDSSVRGLVPMDDLEAVGVTLAEGDLLVLSSDDLTELRRCEVAIDRPWHGAQLDDGTVVLSSESAIGTACVGQPRAWLDGQENMEVLPMGDHALVLDRLGYEQGFDPNLGIGRLVGPDGIIGAFPTAKNTGFGALDPVTGSVWVNSEGTSEVLAMDPTTGAFSVAVRGGTFLDGLTADPEDSSVLYATGRLSDTIVRIEADEATASTAQIHWPFSPVLDLQRDLLWVLSHTEGTLHALDRDDLSLQRSIDPGLGSNTLLSFGNIMMHMDRGTLFFAESQQDLLLEIDPDSGAELGRWDLGGPIITDYDEVGELAMRVAPGSEQVYVVRSNDARVQRLDPGTGELETLFLPQDVADALSDGHKTDFLRHYPSEGLLYLGGKAVRLGTLERWEAKDLPVTRIAGRHPTRQDQWIAVDDSRRHIVRLDHDGEELGSIGFSRHELYATVFKVSTEERSVYMTRALHGNVCSFPVRELK
jgi:hypothetical protein